MIVPNELQKEVVLHAGVVKSFIKSSAKVSGLEIPKRDVICLGTPLQVRMFCHNYPRRSAMTNALTIVPKRYCFDLDNTLVTFPLVPGDYSTCEPIPKNIAKVRHLKAFGHTIIIYTARRMKTHKGDVGKVVADVGALTIATLDKFNIPYDEIYFGNLVDAYIDDLAISAYDDLEKALGYYRSVIPPRHFNSVECTNISLYTKRSKDLSGEIFYYRNIPTPVKDIFPFMIDYGADNTWYSMEKIDSLPASTLFTSELMRLHNHLRHILGTLNRLHAITSEEPQDIYANYIPKISSIHSRGVWRYVFCSKTHL